MGKGKGSLVRYCSRILQNHNLFEFIGFPIKEIIALKKIFRKKLNVPIKINSVFFKNGDIIFNKYFYKNISFKRYNK